MRSGDGSTESRKMKGRASVTDGIPASLPALVLATKLLRRAGDVDVDPVPASVAAVADRAYEDSDDRGELLLALDVNGPAGETRSESRILTLFADRQRELEVRHDHLGAPGLGVAADLSHLRR